MEKSHVRDETIIPEINQFLKRISRQKIRLSSTEIISFLQTCTKINNLNNFANSIRSIYGLNSFIQKGIIEFSAFVYDRFTDTSFHNSKIMIVSNSGVESWIEFLNLIVNLNRLNLNKEISPIYCYEYIEALIYLNICIRKSYINDGIDHNFDPIMSNINIFFSGNKSQISKLISDNLFLKILIEISEQLDNTQTICQKWDDGIIEILEKILNCISSFDIFRILISNQILKFYLEMLNDCFLNLKRSLLIFRLISIFIIYCDKHAANQQAIKMINDFEQFNGYQICIDYLIKKELRSDYDLFFRLFKIVTNILLLISYFRVSDNDTYVVLFKKQSNDRIVRNFKSINIFTIFFVENESTVFGSIIVDHFQNIIQNNNKNFKIFSEKGILSVIIINSVDKNEEIQDRVIDFLQYIFDNFMNSDLNGEMTTIAQILLKKQISFNKKILNLFYFYFDKKLFLHFLESSRCVESILENLTYLFESESEREIKVVEEILENIIKLFGTKRIFEYSDSLITALNFSLDIMHNFEPTRQILSLFLNHGSQKILDYLLLRLKNTSLLNIDVNLSVIQFLNLYYKSNLKSLEILIKSGGLYFFSNQIWILAKFTDEIDYKINFKIILTIFYFLKSIIGLFLSILNYNNRSEPFFFIRFGNSNFMDIKSAILEFKIYQIDFSDANVAKNFRFLYYQLFQLFFLATFDDDSIYKIDIPNEYDEKFVIPIGTIKYPHFMAMIIEFIDMICKYSVQDNDYFCMFLKEVLCKYSAILESRFNSECMNYPIILDSIIPNLLSIGKFHMFEEYIKKIFYPIISHSNLHLVFRNYFKYQNVEIPYFYYELLNQCKYKPLDNFRVTFQIPYTETFQYFYSPKLSPELDSVDMYKSSSETNFINEFIGEEIVSKYDSKSIVEILDEPEKKSKQLDEVIPESQEIKMDAHFLETLTENSTQWESVKSFLLPTASLNKKMNISLESLNLIPEIDLHISDQNKTSKDFSLVFSLISTVSKYLKELNFDSYNNEISYFKVNVYQNQFCFILIPSTVKNTFFYTLKSHFELLTNKVYPKPQFSYSVWFRVNSCDSQNVTINIISLSYNEININRKIHRNVNFLSVVYHVFWKKLVITSEARCINDLDVIESISDTKYKTNLHMDIKNEAWHQIILCIDGTKSINSQNNITIYLDGNLFASFPQFFERLSNDEVFFETKIGTVLPTKDYFSSYDLSGIILANKIFSELDIHNLYLAKIDDYRVYENDRTYSLKLNFSLKPQDSIFLQKSILFKIDPCANVAVFDEYPVNSFSLSSQLVSTISMNSECKLIKNSLFSQSDCVFRSSSYTPNCFMISSNISSFSIQSIAEINKSLFLSYGASIFIILVDQCKDSESLFLHVNSIINFICSNRSISSYITKDFIETLVFVLKQKRDLIDIKITLLLISLSSNSICVALSITKIIILNLIMDFELWFLLGRDITIEILKHIKNILFEPKALQINIDKYIIENNILDSLFICLLSYEIESSCQNITNEIIEYILTYHSSDSVIKKYFQFVLDATIWKTLPYSVRELCNSPGSTSENFSILIMVLIHRFYFENYTSFIDNLESSIGIYGLIILLEYSKSVEISRYSLNIIAEIIQSYKLVGTDLVKGNECLIITEFKRLSIIYSKIEKLIRVPNYNEICFYFAKILAESVLTFNQVTSFLVHLMCECKPQSNYEISNPDTFIFKYLFTKIAENNLKNTLIDNSCTKYTELFILTFQYFYEVLRKYDSDKLSIIAKELLYFVQSVELIIFSSSEINKTFLCFDFVHGIVNIYSFLDSKIDFNIDTNTINYLKETLLKIITSVYEKSLKLYIHCEISKNWGKAECLQDYPHLMLYSMLISTTSSSHAVKITSHILSTTFNSLINLQNNLSYIKIKSDLINMVSTFISSHSMIHGNTFDPDHFLMIVKFTRFAFSNFEENYNVAVSEYSCSLNNYISILMVYNDECREKYFLKFKRFIPIFSSNAHILINSNNKHAESLKHLMSMFFYHCLFVTINKDIFSDHESLVFFKESFSWLRSIYDIFLLYHNDLFCELIYEMCTFCYPVDSSYLTTDFDKVFNNPVELFSTIKDLNNGRDVINQVNNLLITKLDIYILKDDEKMKYLENYWSESHQYTVNWFKNLFKSLKCSYISKLSSYQHNNIIEGNKNISRLQYIQESLYHNGNRQDHVDTSIERFESLISSGYFGVFQRFRKFSAFYYNHGGRIKSCGRKELTSKSEYTNIFKDELSRYSEELLSLSIKDINSFISSIFRPRRLNPVCLINRYMEDKNIIFCCRIVRIFQIDAIEGVILLLNSGILIIDGLCLTPQKIIVESNLYPDEKYFTNFMTQKCSFNKSSFQKYIPYENLVCVRKRRYGLISCAMEIFDYDNYSIFLAFNKPERKAFLFKLTRYLKRYKKFNESKSELNSLFTHFEPLISTLLDLKVKKVQDKWIDGQIDNFTYLLYLNIRAGRTYNDFSQYPIFPWILSKYSNLKLNLNDEKSFRNIGKSMGAQDSERLKIFQHRYREWDNISEKLPKFLYATFYSTSMNTCSYLVRMEPFSSRFIDLQGGNFDLPDRMFNSLQDSYNSSSRTSSADIKELIPEFFYLSEFLKNSNKFIFGDKQCGDNVSDVILPPWAREDPREFIRLNRMALESEYISQNIHHWIDLIFGYKQTGKNAIKSDNVFHSWFYKGSVLIENINDPTIKNSIISFINNFGQVPKKLFIEPHPKRKPINFKEHINNIFLSDEPNITVISELKSIPISDIYYINKKFYVAFEFQILVPPYYKNKLCWDFLDNNLYYMSNINGSHHVSKLLDTTFHGNITNCLFLNVKYIAIGTTDGKISIWKYKHIKEFKLKFIKFLLGHTNPISALAASSHQKFMVSGSLDGNVYQWDLIDLTFIRRVFTVNKPIKSLGIVKTTSDVIVFQENMISVFTAQLEKLTSSNINNLVYCGIPIDNDLQDEYQHLVISTTKGIEIWRYGFDYEEFKEKWCLIKRENDWQDINIDAQPVMNQKSFSNRVLVNYRDISLSKYLHSGEFVTSLKISHENFALYVGTNHGNIITISLCNSLT